MTANAWLQLALYFGVLLALVKPLGGFMARVYQGEPHLLHSLTEWRAMLEAATLPWTLPVLGTMPRGDGHTVMLLPGFMANDASLFALKMFLVSRGYDVRTWGFGRNVGLRSRQLQALEQKIRHLHHVTGRKVSLVGWSLGGVFALYGAHHATECVRTVITLGSPVSHDPEGSHAAPMVQALYRLIAHPLGPQAHAMRPQLKALRSHEKLELPISCLYSLGDGVVPPQEATLHGNPRWHENIRVPGSHTGLGFNAVVMSIVADRLAQPEGAWKPFSPRGWQRSAYRLLTGGAAPA